MNDEIRRLVFWQIQLNRRGDQTIRWRFWQKKTTFAKCLPDGPEEILLLGRRHKLEEFHQQEIKPYKGNSLGKIIARTWRKVTGNFSQKNQLYIYAKNRKTLQEEINALSDTKKKEYEEYAIYIEEMSSNAMKKEPMFSAAHIQSIISRVKQQEVANEASAPANNQDVGIKKAAATAMKKWQQFIYQRHFEELTKQYRPDPLVRLDKNEALQTRLLQIRKDGVAAKIKQGQKIYPSSIDKKAYATECNRLFDVYEESFRKKVQFFMQRLIPDAVRSKQRVVLDASVVVALKTNMPQQLAASVTQKIVVSAVSHAPRQRQPDAFLKLAVQEPMSATEFEEITKTTRAKLRDPELGTEAIKEILVICRQQRERYIAQLTEEAIRIMQAAEKANKDDIKSAIPQLTAKVREISQTCRQAWLIFHSDKHLARKDKQIIDDFASEQLRLLTISATDKQEELKNSKSENWKLDELSAQLDICLMECKEGIQYLHEETERLKEETERLKEETERLKEETEKRLEEKLTNQLEEKLASQKEETERLKKAMAEQEARMSEMMKLMLANQQAAMLSPASVISPTLPEVSADSVRNMQFWQAPHVAPLQEEEEEEEELKPEMQVPSVPATVRQKCVRN